MELYVFRRRLQMGVDEVKALPWWQRRIYVEGLIEEYGDEDDKHRPEVVGSADNLTELGFSVGTA